MQSKTTSNGIAALREVAVERLNWARNVTQGLLGGLADDQCVARPNGRGNHALWVMGHIAWIDDQILHSMADQSRALPEKWIRMFGSGSEPSNNPADYPSRQELADAMRTNRQRIIEWVKSLDEETAWRPTPNVMRPIAPDAITTAFAIVGHELLHAGQVAAVRSSLGLPRLFM
jgi:hypothetical protein